MSEYHLVNVSGAARRCWSFGRRFFGDGDWLFLTVLGMGMALFSFAMDDCIEKIGKGKALHKTLNYPLSSAVLGRNWLYHAAGSNTAVQYLAWTGPKLVLVLTAAILCQVVAPQAMGKDANWE